jgi:hypothetical protein
VVQARALLLAGEGVATNEVARRCQTSATSVLRGGGGSSSRASMVSVGSRPVGAGGCSDHQVVEEQWGSI